MNKLAVVLARIVGYVFALFIGIFPALFLVFKAIFSEDFSALDHLGMSILVILTYGVLGLAFSFVLPSLSWHWAIWLSLMAFLLVAWYSTFEVEQIPLNVLYLVTTGISAYLGTLLGTRLSLKRRRKGN